MRYLMLIFLSFFTYGAETFHGSVIYLNQDSFKFVWNLKPLDCPTCKNEYEVMSYRAEPNFLPNNPVIIGKTDKNCYTVKYEHAGFYGYALRRCGYNGAVLTKCDTWEFTTAGGCFYADIGQYHQNTFVIFWKLPKPGNVIIN